MAWLTALTTLVGPVANAVSTWQARRAQVSEAKHEVKLERIRQMDNDKKDEFLLAIWSAPFLCVFIPPLQPYAFTAFEFLQDLPQWYLGGWVAISLAIFGVDKVTKVRK